MKKILDKLIVKFLDNITIVYYSNNCMSQLLEDYKIYNIGYR